MAKETITIQSRSDLITAASGRQYFTVTDDTQRKLVCFNPALHELLPLGATVKDVDIQAGKKEDDTPRITSVGEVGKESAKTTGRSYGKSDKELTQVRQLAEAQNRSIQAQTALNRAVDLTVCVLTYTQDTTPDNLPKFGGAISELTNKFYQLLQSLTLISEAKVIHKKIEEAKSEVTKTSKGSKADNQSKDEGEDSGQDSNEMESSEPKTVGEFLTWLAKNKIKAPRAWLEVEYKVSSAEVLTIEKCQELYATIKKDKKFNN